MEQIVTTEMAALSAQEKLLVSCYLKCMNKSQAAKDAGYATTSPFNKATVKAAIAAQLETRASRLLVGGDWVLRQLVTVFERCNQVEKILDREGRPTGEFKFDASNSLKALSLIGQHVDVKAFTSDVTPGDTVHAQAIVERLQRATKRRWAMQDQDALLGDAEVSPAPEIAQELVEGNEAQSTLAALSEQESLQARRQTMLAGEPYKQGEIAVRDEEVSFF